MEANRAKILAFEQTYYSDVPLLAEPADYHAKGFEGEMTPLWAFLNPTTPSRWFEPDSNQPVVFFVNPTGAPSFLELQEDMQAAMSAWSVGSLRVNYGGATGGCGVQVADGANTISFNNCDNYFSASQGCSGLLAVSGIVRYMPNQTIRSAEPGMQKPSKKTCLSILTDFVTLRIAVSFRRWSPTRWDTGLGWDTHPTQTRRWQPMYTLTIAALR